METSLEVLDWNELQKFRNADDFGDWRVELDEEPAWILSDEDAGWINDSASCYFEVSEALKTITRKLPSDQAKCLKGSIILLIVGNEKDYVQDFPCPCSGGDGYFMAISPKRV